MPVKQEVKDSLTGKWQIGLFEAPCKAPVSFCYGCCCSCCMAGQQRLELLDLLGEPYVCCAGMFPCGPLGQPQDRNCAWCESCCCTGCAISGNRFYIQTRFDRQNTACDDCILWTTCIVSWLVCIASMVCDVPEEVQNCVDCMIQIVNGCMLAQQQHEIKHVKSVGFQGPPQSVMQHLTPHQQNLMQQGRPPQQQMTGGGGGAPPGMPLHGGMSAPPQVAPMTMGRKCENLEWRQMQEHEKQAAQTLGLNQYMWDNDQDGPFSNTEWRHLTPQQQQAALTIGISARKWDED